MKQFNLKYFLVVSSRTRLVAAVAALPIILWIFLLLSPLIAYAQPTLSIGDTTVGIEANSGSGQATFTVTRSETGQTSSVLYSTSAGTATGGSSCGGNTDFLNLTSASLSFSTNETSKTIPITVCGDTLDEADETFFVNLHDAGGATIADGQGQATLVDDDSPPSLRINDVTVTEGNAGSANATFTVTLSAASGQNVTVVYATANDTATGGTMCGGAVDFVNSNNSLTFTPGVTTQPVAIAVCGDTTNESTERFRVNLTTPVNATIQDSQGFGTITTDEGTLPTLTINDRTVTEPGNAKVSVSAVFTLTLTTANPAGATVYFTTVNGTAIRSLYKICTAPGDFILKGGNLQFGPTETTKTVTIPICHDTVDEPNETFQVQLSSGVGLTIGDATGVGIINDND